MRVIEYRLTAKWLVTIPLVALLAGCGGTGTIRNSIPAVTSTTPANTATSVAVNSKYAAYFNLQMNPASFTTSNVTLTPQGGSAIAGTVNALGNAVVFAPSSNLATNTVYTAAIDSGVASASGAALTSNFTWTFTTSASSTPDTTPPTVTAMEPLSGATGVSRGSAITASFSKSMDPTTITTTTFTVTGPGVTPVAGTVSDTGAVATFTPSNTLASNTTFTATVTTGVKDLEGNAMAAQSQWLFTTGS